MPRLTTAEATVETLLRHGIDTVYALPGLHNDPLFDAFSRRRPAARDPSSARTGRGLHGARRRAGDRQAAGFAVVPGPGLLNASAALLTAYGMYAPVVALIGQIPQVDIDEGHGHLHEFHDQIGLSRHFTKFADRIRAPHRGAGAGRPAVQQAISGRQRPVLLECAMDTWQSASGC